MSAPADTSRAGLEYRSADLGYGASRIVGGANLDVAFGEFVGLVGPNGAGKSTLLRAVTGTADILAGQVLVDGQPAAMLGARDRARVVGVVPQSPPALFAFTAREFVAMGRHPHLGRLDALSSADEAIVDRALELTDTARLAREAVDTLSGGDLQRLTLAQALAQEPRVLLLDEPTSHLDLNHRLQVLDLVRELTAEGIAVLGVFHDLDLAARYSDRIAVVHDGVVAPCGTPAKVITPELVREVFSVRAVVGLDAVTGTVAVTPVMREQAAPVRTRGSVFLVGGSGAAASLMRRLVLAGFEVTCGALSRGDVDHAVATALGVQFVELPPFGEIEAEGQTRVEDLARAADVRIVCEVPFGRSNLGNLIAVASAGSPLGFVGGFDESRDFAGGQALDVARAALLAGATALPDTDAALAFAESCARRAI